MDTSTKLALSPAVMRRDLGASSVLLDLEDGTYFEVSGVGVDVFRLLQERSLSVDEICDRLIGRFAVELDVLRADVMAFVVELLERGLIARVRTTA